MINNFTKMSRITFLACVMMLATVSSATTYTYNSALLGNWTNTNYWSPSYPGTTIAAGDEAIINGICIVNTNLSFNGIITNNGQLIVSSGNILTVNNGGIFTSNYAMLIYGEFTNEGFFKVSNGGGLTIAVDASFTHDGTTANIEGALTNNGIFMVQAGKSLLIAGTGTFTHDGTQATIHGVLTNNGSMTVESSKTLNISNGGEFVHGGDSGLIKGILDNEGDVTVNDGKTLSVTGSFVHHGTTAIIKGTLMIGSIIGLGGTLLVATDKTLVITSSGTLTHNGFSATIDGLLTNNGKITVNSGKSLVISASGKLIHQGIVADVDGTLINNGILRVNDGKVLDIYGAFAHQGLAANIFGNLRIHGSITVGENHTLDIKSTGYVYLYSSATSADIYGTLKVDGDITISTKLTIKSTGTYDHNSTHGAITNGGCLDNEGVFVIQPSMDLYVQSNFGELIQNGISATIDGRLNIDGILTIKGGKQFTVGSSGVLEGNGNVTVNGFLNNLGVVRGENNFIVNGVFTHDGVEATFENLLTINGGLTVLNGKTLTVANGGSLTHQGILATIYGTLKNLGSLNVKSGKLLTIANGGLFNQQGTTDTIFGTISNLGTVKVFSGSQLVIPSSGVFSNSGTATIIDGTLKINNGVFNNSSALTGSGTIEGNANFTNPSGGTIAPGNSPGCLALNTDFNNDGTLEIELADGSACTNFDQINVTGNAVLNGVIDINFTGGVAPSMSSFTIITSTGVLSGSPTINWPAGYTGTGYICAFCSPQEFQVSFSPLPVELVFFQANKRDENSVELKWQTASEQNNRGFKIQRSNDGIEWENIGFVEGAGTTTEEQHYSLIDRPNASGMFYYRLRQMDFDGESDFSPVRSVNLENKNSEIKIFPNPATSFINIQLENEWEGELTLLLVNPIGQTVYAEKRIKSEEIANWKIDLSNFSIGIHQVIISDGKNTMVHSAIKSKN